MESTLGGLALFWFVIITPDGSEWTIGKGTQEACESWRNYQQSINGNGNIYACREARNRYLGTESQ